MGKGFSKMKKQAKRLQEELDRMQKEAEKLRVTGSAGGGLVEVTLDGEKHLVGINIRPDCVDPNDIEGLQDLIIAAYQDAASRVKEENPTDSLIAGLPFQLQ